MAAVAPRAVGDAADCELGALRIHHRRTGNDGKIAMPPSDLAEGVAGAAARPGKAHGFDQLVILAIGRHHAGEECCGGDPA